MKIWKFEFSSFLEFVSVSVRPPVRPSIGYVFKICSAAEDCRARDLVLGRPSTVRPPSVHCLSAVRPPSVHRPSTVRACIVKQYKKFLKFQISSKIQKLKFSNFHAFLDFIRPSSVRPSAFIRPPSLRPTQPASQPARKLLLRPISLGTS